jgi:hypothetical protein
MTMRTIRTVVALALAVLPLGALSAAPIIGPKAEEGADKWLLDDAESVTVVNFKAALKSDLLSKGPLADLIKKGLGEEKVKEALDALGLDPMKDVDSIIASGTNITDKDKQKTRVVFRGKFNPEKLTAFIKKSDKVKSSEVGKVTVFEFEAGPQTFFGAFHGKEAFVITESKESTAALAKDGPSKAPKKLKQMAAALKRFSGKEAFASAVVLTEETKKTFPPGVPAELKQINGISIAVTLGKDIDLTIVGNSEDGKAAGLAKKLSDVVAVGRLAIGAMDQVPEDVKKLLDDVKIDNTRDTITLKLTVSKDVIEKALKMGGGF